MARPLRWIGLGPLPNPCEKGFELLPPLVPNAFKRTLGVFPVRLVFWKRQFQRLCPRQ